MEFNYLYPERQFLLYSSVLKEFADDNFEFDENGKKFSKSVEETLWDKVKLLVTSKFSFSHGVCKGLVKQTRKNNGLYIWERVTFQSSSMK